MCTKRSRSSDAGTEEKVKVQKTVDASGKETAVTPLPADVCAKLDEEHTCAISQEIPIDPVLASDGMTYERFFIEAHIERLEEAREKLTSPLTREAIDKKLKPNRNVRNLCELLIKGGYWVGEKAEAWLAKEEEHEKNSARVKAMEANALSGDSNQAYQLGQAYALGAFGLRKNEKEAYKWYMVGAENGCAFGACAVGLAYVNGDYGFEKNQIQGMAWIQTSAVLGSECGCYEVANAYRRGLRGYPMNLTEAAKWYRRMPDCDILDAKNFDRRKRAKEFLDEHSR